MFYLKQFVLILLAVLTISCGQNNPRNPQKKSDKPVITVTIEPLRYFTEAIAGDEFEVVSMVPKGSSPENYDPTPQQLMELSKSKAFLRIGHIGFEQVWMDKLSDNAPHLQFFDTSRGIELIYDETHHEGVEPHVWTSALNAHILATNILNALCVLDKEHKSQFIARYDSLLQQISQTDSLMAATLGQPEANRAFMIYHPSLSYFARDYNLLQIPIEMDGKEPSPAQLKKLMEVAKKEQVRIIFIQPEFDRRHAEIIAKELNAQIVEINPLSYQWREEMLRVTQALSGKQAH